MLSQWRTEGILAARFAELGGRIEHDAGLLELTQNENHVTATLTTGETIHAAYLVGVEAKMYVRRTCMS
jgi:2-polyprenyl-6-methoxyphenol hydroxylase-like FAD-dependent oxidoreductase